MSDLRIDGLGQIAVTVADTARATSFYRDTLGLRLLFEALPSLAFFECSGIRIMLAPPEPSSGQHASSVLYFRVADIDAAHVSLRREGVRCEGEPHVVHRASDHDLWMVFFYDGEGNMHALMEERPRVGASTATGAG